MEKVTKKEIKRLCQKDITDMSARELCKLKTEKQLDTLYYSVGKIGCNGCIAQGNDGVLYGVLRRSSALLILL